MSETSIPWQLTQEYLEATDWTLRPGAPTTYVVPRRIGNSPQDITSFHPGQTYWSIDSLPACMYQLEPMREWELFQKSARPAQKKDAHGQLMWVDHPEKPGKLVEVLDFSILPEKIGTMEEWWYFEAIRRIDPRVRWLDILMRMERVGRMTKNDLQSITRRTWRPLYSMIPWFKSNAGSKNGTQVTKETKAVYSSLPQSSIKSNSTRGYTPGLKVPGRLDLGFIPHPVLRKGQGEHKGPRSKKIDNAAASSQPEALRVTPNGPPQPLEMVSTTPQVARYNNRYFRRVEPYGSARAATQGQNQPRQTIGNVEAAALCYQGVQNDDDTPQERGAVSRDSHQPWRQSAGAADTRNARSTYALAPRSLEGQPFAPHGSAPMASRNQPRSQRILFNEEASALYRQSYQNDYDATQGGDIAQWDAERPWRPLASTAASRNASVTYAVTSMPQPRSQFNPPEQPEAEDPESWMWDLVDFDGSA